MDGSSHVGASGPGAPAGWYPMPDGTQRYWDGLAWTHHVAPGQYAPAPSPFVGGSAGQPFHPPGANLVDTSNDDRTLALLAHMLSIVGGFIAPLVIWLVKKDESGYVAYHAKESLNFQLTMMIYWLVTFLLMILLIGFLIFPFLLILGFVMPIVAGLAANRGEPYRYPMTIRFVN